MAQSQEIARLVVRHRVLEKAVNELDAQLHIGEKWIEVRLPGRLLQPPVERVDLLVQLCGKRRTDGLCSQPRGGHTRPHGWPQRPGDDTLDRLIAAVAVPSRPTRPL